MIRSVSNARNERRWSGEVSILMGLGFYLDGYYTEKQQIPKKLLKEDLQTRPELWTGLPEWPRFLEDLESGKVTYHWVDPSSPFVKVVVEWKTVDRKYLLHSGGKVTHSKNE